MSAAEERRRRQSASIGFIPAPAGQSARAQAEDDDALIHRLMRGRLPDGTVHAYMTADGVHVLDLRPEDQ